MGDLPHTDWYAAQLGGEPVASNPFGNPMFAERRNSALDAHIEAGGKLSDFIASQPPPANTRAVMEEAFASMERRASALKAVANANRMAAE